jgi:hypothetical protein
MGRREALHSAIAPVFCLRAHNQLTALYIADGAAGVVKEFAFPHPHIAKSKIQFDGEPSGAAISAVEALIL